VWVLLAFKLRRSDLLTGTADQAAQGSRDSGGLEGGPDELACRLIGADQETVRKDCRTYTISTNATIRRGDSIANASRCVGWHLQISNPNPDANPRT